MRSPVHPAVTRRHALRLAAAVGASLCLPGRASAAHVVKPWPAARPVPELELSDLDGKPWKLAAHTGKVLVLNFWATWCEPCRVEMPSLDSLSVKHKPNGLVVCAINYKESAETIRKFLEKMPFKATILLDSEGDATSDWTPRVFPTTVLIGRDGKPTHLVVGDLDWTGGVAKGLLEPMLAVPRKA